MAESNKTEKIYFDGPTRGLLGLVAGLAALIVGLSVRAYFQLPGARPAVAPTVKHKAPLPRQSASALRVWEASALAVPGWQLQPDAREPDSLRLVAPSGAVFEQKVLTTSDGLSPRAFAERIDARLTPWGQEYQRIRLGSVEQEGARFTRLEYALNLPGKPTQRVLVLVGRLRVAGKRRMAAFTFGAPEERFYAEMQALGRAGINLPF